MRTSKDQLWAIVDESGRIFRTTGYSRACYVYGEKPSTDITRDREKWLRARGLRIAPVTFTLGDSK